MEKNNKKALIEYLITSWNYTNEEAIEIVEDLEKSGYYEEHFGDFLLEVEIDKKDLYIWTDIDNLYTIEEEILLQYLSDTPKIYNPFEKEIKDHLIYNIDRLIEEISFNKSIIKEWINDELYLGEGDVSVTELKTMDGFIYE